MKPCPWCGILDRFGGVGRWAVLLFSATVLLILGMGIPLGTPVTRSVVAQAPLPPTSVPTQVPLSWFPIARGNRETWFTPTTPPPFGFETNTGRIMHPQVFTRARELGATWIRINTVSWLAVQPKPERIYHWDALATFEQEILAARRAGLIPIVVVDDYPAWATKPYWDEENQRYTHARCGPIDEAYFPDYAAFLGELVRRYSKPPYEVRYWELGNEPDVDPRLLTEFLQLFFGCWGDIDDPYYGGRHYGAMLQAVVPVMREADPRALILNGGLALDRPETHEVGLGKPERFFEGILLSGAADMFDIVGYHVYVWHEEVASNNASQIARHKALTDRDHAAHHSRSPHDAVKVQLDPDHQDEQWRAWGGATVGKVRYLRALLERYGADVNRPFFLNETGLVGYPPHDAKFFEAQANHLVRQLTVAMSVGVQSYIWYTLHESGWLSAGLLDPQYRPRAPYRAYQQFIRQVQGSNLRPVPIADYGTQVAAYRFAGPDGYVDVVWSTRAASQTISIPLLTMRQVIGRDGEILSYEVRGDEVRVDVGMRPVYIRSAYPPPHIDSVIPSASYPGTRVRIAGSGFVKGAQVTLCHRPLEGVTVRDGQTIDAIVPANFPAATCSLEVTNLDGQVNTLPLGHTTLTTASPQVTAIRPNRWAPGRTDSPLPLASPDALQAVNIYGQNFSSPSWVTIGTTVFTPTRISGTHLQVLLRPSDLPFGSHPLTITVSDGRHTTIPEAYILYSPDDDDMTADAFDCTHDPITPRVDQPVRIQLSVHRYGGNIPHHQVPVHFTVERWPDSARTRGHDGQDDDPKQRIGDAETTNEFVSTIPVLRPNESQIASAMWIPRHVGTYTLTATIDPQHTFSETITTNNRITRTVVVRSSWPTTTPPEITKVAITSPSTIGKAGSIAVTTQPTVNIALEIPELQGSLSSVLILLVEYSYTTDTYGNEQWVPVQQSGWITHTAATTYTWRLTPMAGEKHLQVWVATRNGDVRSIPAYARVVYLPEGSDPLTPHARTMPGLTWIFPPLPSFPSHPIYLPLLWRS